MYNILYSCTFVCLAFALVYGNECEKETKKNKNYKGCSIYEIESEDACHTSLKINDEEKNFVFYMKPLIGGQLCDLSISLYKRYSKSSWSEIKSNLFKVTIKDTSVWNKIKIWPSGNFTYNLEVNDKHSVTVSFSGLQLGNEIRVKGVSSLWSFPCDPRQPSPAATNHLPVWQLGIIAAAVLVLIMVVIIMIATLVLRHKKRTRDPAMIQSTDHQPRLSRHVSENSLYESYDNSGTGENQVPHVVIKSGTSSATNNSNSATDNSNSATNNSNQRRGSAHDSENSLYIGLN
ncbi:unnamed protein product [Meganyctiphanes norvegica]|uniref:CUB domain-containing protein n=1 Tax=Meganyctiphanes norvegica TaxID=48144 RepID=A0AAV2PM81_MEGNR